jgi:pimeloyl-ACP methyl ester carboxylesterase
MTERRVKPLPFIQTGSGANALVFIHGFLDDGSFWRTTIQALETRNLALVTLNLPGMGKAADDPGPFSLDRLAQAVTSVVDPVNRPTVLVGHSMGARHVPDVRDKILAVDVLTPDDLRARNPNAVSGDPYGGSAELDQSLLWRPLASAGRHATPVGRLWHIGASTHPGAGLAGGSGHLVATTLTKRRTSRR